MKRLLSLALVLALMLSMVPAAFAAGSEVLSFATPASQTYVDGIEGAEFALCISAGDVLVDSAIDSASTIELYNVSELSEEVNGSWPDIVAPFREAFVDAGFTETVIVDDYGEEEYAYIRDEESADGNEFFAIGGQTLTKEIAKSVGAEKLVYIFHCTVLLTDAQSSAEALYELGLFNGTGTDANGDPIFDLDRTPTRSEAVTMLVRLLGKEEEAKSGTWNMPFTDVAEWAKPYVGYAYANGLVAGTSATTFGGSDPVTATQYFTFVLRSLGYTSGTDFQWNKAWELADELGLTNGEYNASTTSFTRGDVATISYRSLFLDGKDTDAADSGSSSTQTTEPSTQTTTGSAQQTEPAAAASSSTGGATSSTTTGTTSSTTSKQAESSSFSNSSTVYVSNSGKIHKRSNCSGMKNYSTMTYGEAKSKGYTECKNCF